MPLAAFACAKCTDAKGRPVKLGIGTVRPIAHGFIRRWRRCPVCKASVVTDEKLRDGAKPVALAASATDPRKDLE